jgi:hypothetical protein
MTTPAQGPRTLPDELVKIARSEPFQLFLEQEAERRISIVLKRLALFASPFLLALAFFGFEARQSYRYLEQTRRHIEEDAKKVEEAVRLVGKESQSAALARQAAESSALKVSQNAREAEVSAQRVVSVEGHMESVSKALTLTASLGSDTAQKLLDAAHTSRTELQAATQSLSQARSQVETLKTDLQSRLDAVDGLSKAIENLNRASVLRVLLLKSRTSRPFDLPDPVRPEQSWRLHFRTSGLGAINPWTVEWSYEKLSASSAPVEGKPLIIDRLRGGAASGRLEGTPFSYRLDLAYHAKLADDFIALSISTPATLAERSQVAGPVSPPTTP